MKQSLITAFDWTDPFGLDAQLSDEERLVRDTAESYAQEKLQPRVTEAYLEESFDRQIMREMGALGLLGATIPTEYGGAGLDYVSYGLVARAVERQQKRPAIVFCTAYDQHAVAAFDVAAVDYVLKPVSAERLAKAVGRVHEARARAGPAEAASRWVQEFWVPHRSEMLRVAARDIERIDAERDYMRLTVAGRSYLLHETISELERRLDPSEFVRLHRSTIVRRDSIARLAHDGLGAWRAELKDGSEVRIGRTYQAVARAIAGR